MQTVWGPKIWKNINKRDCGCAANSLIIYSEVVTLCGLRSSSSWEWNFFSFSQPFFSLQHSYKIHRRIRTIFTFTHITHTFDGGAVLMIHATCLGHGMMRESNVTTICTIRETTTLQPRTLNPYQSLVFTFFFTHHPFGLWLST